MNYLTCVQCGRSAHVLQPPAIDDLGRNGLKVLCPCGASDSWLWTAQPCGKSDLPTMREQRFSALRAAAIAAAIPKTTPEDTDQFGTSEGTQASR